MLKYILKCTWKIPQDRSDLKTRKAISMNLRLKSYHTSFQPQWYELYLCYKKNRTISKVFGDCTITGSVKRLMKIQNSLRLMEIQYTKIHGETARAIQA